MDNSSIIKQLVDSIKNDKTNMDECLQKTDELLENIKSNLKTLGASSSSYMLEYDKYLYNNVIDGDLLKEKLKDNIVKVLNRDV